MKGRAGDALFPPRQLLAEGAGTVVREGAELLTGVARSPRCWRWGWGREEGAWHQLIAVRRPPAPLRSWLRGGGTAVLCCSRSRQDVPAPPPAEGPRSPPLLQHVQPV